MTTLPHTPNRLDVAGGPNAPSAPLGTAHGFAIGLDGRATGDDGRSGRLAPAVHYAARMAAQLDSALDLGPLRHVHVAGTSEIDVRVGWGLGGECLLEGVVRDGAPTPPLFLDHVASPGAQRPGHMSEAIWLAAQQGTRSAAHLDDAVRRLHAATGAAWTVLLDAELTALRLLGDLAPGPLAVLSSRTQGVVLGLGETGLATLTLVYATGSVVLSPLREATLIFFVDLHDLGQVAEVLRTARRALTEVPPEPAPVLTVATEPEPESFEQAWNDERIEVPTGARFAGMVKPERPADERRTPRWLRR